MTDANEPTPCRSALVMVRQEGAPSGCLSVVDEGCGWRACACHVGLVPVTLQPQVHGKSRMKLFYGWVIVAVGIVVGCIGMGGLMSFGVFLQPMADSLGWSRAGISMASTLAFLWMGVGGFLWGRLFDRYGARVVVLLGGLLQGFGLVAASQAQSLPAFLAAYGAVVGLAV